MLSDASKRALDALFEKAGKAGQPATDTPAGPPDASTDESPPVQRARLTLLKSFSHSLKPSKIRENLADRQTIADLYRPLRETVRSLDLTPDGLRYYAHAVIKAEVFQVSRRADPGRHLHLLCFIAHQYFHLNDLLIDVLLIAVQNARNVCQREHRTSTTGSEPITGGTCGRSSRRSGRRCATPSPTSGRSSLRST
jgi:hypothetical protein